MNSTNKYQLAANPEVLRALMRRTGDGRSVSIRGLAEAANVHHSTIGHLLTGVQISLPASAAQAVADRIGVDLHVLFERNSRTTRARRRRENSDAAGADTPAASVESADKSAAKQTETISKAILTDATDTAQSVTTRTPEVQA